MGMSEQKRAGIGDYPLTIVAHDSAGNECYRTQLDWAGSERNLDDVPSADLDARRPQWATMKVYDQAGGVVLERTNDRNDESAEDAVAARGPKYANDKAPIVQGDVPNDKDGEREGESDAQASASSVKEPSKSTPTKPESKVDSKADEKDKAAAKK